MAHIPTVDIRQLGDISFDRQLALARQPNRDYDVDRWLFVPNTYTEYRYILGTRGKKPLICVGINPSTARPGALDPTLKSVERIARFDLFDLQHRLPRWMLQIPYDILNRMNRRKLLRENTGLTTSIRMDDYRIEPVGDGCFDLFYIAVK